MTAGADCQGALIPVWPGASNIWHIGVT